MVRFQFKGLVVPVFTPFTYDKKTIDFTVIEKYGHYLKSKGVHGVFVNGMTGEGTTLRIDERKRLAEEWLKVARKFGLTMILGIGGVGVADVYDLVEHAEKIGVDSIALLPDLFYKPKIEEDLIDYMKDIVKYAPTRPILYYHVPEYTKVYLNMVRLCELMKRSITTFAGFYYRHTDIKEATILLKEDITVIMNTDVTLVGVLTLGFDAITTMTLNLYPEFVTEIYDYVLNGKLRDARDTNDKLYRRIKDLVGDLTTTDWIEKFKYEFDKKTDIKVGELRKPRITYDFFKKTY